MRQMGRAEQPRVSQPAEPANPQYLKQDSKNGYGEISWLPLSLHWTPGSTACISWAEIFRSNNLTLDSTATGTVGGLGVGVGGAESLH